MLADALDGVQPKTDAFVGGGEAHAAGVDIWRQHGNAETATFADVKGHFVDAIDEGIQRFCHKFLWIMAFEPACLEGEQTVGGAVALVEAVAGEVFDEFEDLLSDLAEVPPF